MEKEKTKNKRWILLSFILMILVVNLMIVSAADVSQDTWYSKVIDFLKMGETWEEVFVVIFLFLIIASATYDLLSLTMFRNPAVKVLIGIGLAGILSVVGVLRAVNTWVFAVTGEITAVAIGLSIAIAAIAFFLIHVGVSWLAVRIEKASGDVEAERAATAAKKGAARARAVGDVMSH